MSKQDYLFKRGSSKIWNLRLKTPAIDGCPARITDSSLRTDNYEEAMAKALPRILVHLRMVAGMKAQRRLWIDDPENNTSARWAERYAAASIRTSTKFEMEAGQHRCLPNGGREQCTTDGRTIIVYHADGETVTTRPNLSYGTLLHHEGDNREHRTIRKLEAKLRERNPELGDSLDERVIQAWIKARRVNRNREKDARNNAYAVLKRVAPGRNFATYTPDDVRRLVQAWVDNGCSTETMGKLRGHLRGMINAVMDNARKDLFREIKSNPFIGDFIPPGIKGKRDPVRLFTAEDHALIMADLPSWTISYQRLYMVARTTGLRREEMFTVTREETHDNIRCLVVCDDMDGPGKNGLANRLLPIPDALAPFMPEKIEGSLFAHGMSFTSRQTMKLVRAALERAGCDHAGKTLQSLRHGVETRLGHKLVHQKIADAILGHVPEDLKGNKGENQQIRSAKSITYRYFHGNQAQTVLDALNLING